MDYTDRTPADQKEPFSLEELEQSGSEILDRIADKLKRSSDTTAHYSHSSHGSGSHTSSN
jgi:hypothetical protein